MEADEIRERVRCCACEASLRTSAHVNLVTLRRRATWEYPAARNLLTGDGPCAMAVCCDTCVEKPGIRFAVEFRSDDVIYHAVQSLDELGPEPTHVLHETSKGPGIECLVCGKVSYHAWDVAEKYCGYCDAFHPITPAALAR